MKSKRWLLSGILATVLLLILAVGVALGQTHSTTEPTCYYQGVVTNDTGVKMKHVTVVHDPLGLKGAPGNPKFMMWWGSSSPDQLFASTSNDGVNWSGTGTARTNLPVTYPSSTVPVYHPEVIYDRDGFVQKKSAGVVHFKMWFYDAGTEHYNWIRYAESADGISWTIFEDSPCAASGCTNPSNKNYLEFSDGSGNEMSVLYKRGGTGIVVNGVDQEYVGYQATNNPVGISTDGAWFFRVDGQGGGPTDVCREIIITAPSDSVNYRAWDDLPGHGDVTSWDSATGLSWNSDEPGSAPIVGASWSDLYGAMSVVVVGNQYYMYDTLESDNYKVALLIAYLPPTEVWVDDDYCAGCSNEGHIWGYDAFDYIQDGIDAVSDGGKVHVAKGRYNEEVTIDKPLTLMGAKAGIDPRGGTWTRGTSVLNPGSGNTGINIEASDVIVQGFEVTGGMYGIYIGSTDVRNVSISYNDLHDNSKYGLQAIGIGSDVSFINVTLNYFHHNGRNGLKLVDVTDCTIDSNEFAYNGFGPKATKPEYKYGVFIEDQRYNAPEYSPCIRNTLICNRFHDNALGAINMEVLGIAVRSYWSSTEFLEETAVHNNNFYGDHTVWGINVSNDYKDDGTQTGFGPIATVIATNNWWGDASGPSGSGPGTGGIVSDYVDFDPWYTFSAQKHLACGNLLMAKEDIAYDLAELLESADKKDAHRIEKALKHLSKSLDHKLWEDDNHLTNKGKKVFGEEKKAVHKLMKVKNVDVSDFILGLVAVDEYLAQTAIDDAYDNNGDDKKIAKAEKEMEKAQKELDKGKFDKAIEHYKKAWEHAHKAIKKAAV